MGEDLFMRFLLAVIDSRSNSGSADEMEAIDAFNEMLEAKGHWIIACGIDAPENSVVIDNRQPESIANPGPLVDNAEFMSGFWLIKATDRAEAECLAAAGSKACNRKVEVRTLHG
ncbi:MAG: hypothetical protein RL196_567 [Actinomycetota bacterium]